MKTPEELAEGYGWKMWGIDSGNAKIAIEAFLAGYQAAQEHAHAALEEAEVKSDRACQQELQAAASQWISVKEKLPNFGAVVLTANTIGSVNTKYFGVNGFRDEQVTHWMPLPTRPSTQD